MAAFLRPSWWLLPPVAVALVMLGYAFIFHNQLSGVRYRGELANTWLEQPPSVEDMARPYRLTPSEQAIWDKQTAPLGEAQRQIMRAWNAKKIAEAPQRREQSIREHDDEIAQLNAISRATFLIGVAALLLAFPFQWMMRKATPLIGRLLGGLDRALQGSSPADPARPQARLTFKDGRSYSRATVYTLAALGVLSIPAGVLLILFVAGQPNGAGNIVPLLLGGVLILTGLISAPLQLRWVVFINRAQRKLVREIEQRRELREAFHQGATKGSAAFQTGFAPAANSPPARPGPDPAPAAPAKPSIAEDQFRIDLPPPSQSKTS